MAATSIRTNKGGRGQQEGGGTNKGGYTRERVTEVEEDECWSPWHTQGEKEANGSCEREW